MRDVVGQVFKTCRDAGLFPAVIAQVEGELTQADQRLQAKGYKDAYDLYRSAYLRLAVVTGGHRP